MKSEKINQEEKKNRAYLKYLIIKSGITQREIAQRFKVSSSFVSQVIAGKKRSEKIIKYILSLDHNNNIISKNRKNANRGKK